MSMTLENAIEVIKLAQAQIEWDCPMDYAVAFDMAIEALEKQIPKKPIHINKNKEFDGNWKKVCPSCGRMLIERITTPEKSFPLIYNYTQHCWCNQAIDWGWDE